MNPLKLGVPIIDSYWQTSVKTISLKEFLCYDIGIKKLINPKNIKFYLKRQLQNSIVNLGFDFKRSILIRKDKNETGMEIFLVWCCAFKSPVSIKTESDRWMKVGWANNSWEKFFFFWEWRTSVLRALLLIGNLKIMKC